jgi:hypothetical protein
MKILLDKLEREREIVGDRINGIGIVGYYKFHSCRHQR